MPGTLTITTLSDGTNSTSATNAIQGSAKAWVNFGGGSGTTAGVIESSYNVSSITVSSAGQWIVNFTNAFADNKYAVTACGGYNDTVSTSIVSLGFSTKSTTQCGLRNQYQNGSFSANWYTSAAFFR